MAVTPGPRTRINNYESAPDYYPYTVVDNNGNVVFSTFSAFSIFSRDEVMDDVVTENFRERVQSGEIINNPMKKVTTEKSWIIPYFDRVGLTDWRDYGYEKGFITTDVISSPDYSNLISVAVTKSYAKVDSSSASLLVTLGELRETKEMLVNCINSLLHFRTILTRYCDFLQRTVNKYGKRKFTSADVSSEALNMWMQVRFGWLPFVSDVKSLYKALTVMETFAKRQTFRAGSTGIYSSSDSVNRTWTGSHTASFNRTSVVGVNISAGVLCDQRYAGVPDTYGITKIPGVLWELTRLSWAVDYFFNVADVVASFTPDSLWNPLTNWVTVREHKTDVITIKSVTPDSALYKSVVVTGGKFKQVTETVSRYPAVQRGGITFRPKLNWARYIDLVGVAKPKIVKTIKEAIKLYTRTKKGR